MRYVEFRGPLLDLYDWDNDVSCPVFGQDEPAAMQAAYRTVGDDTGRIFKISVSSTGRREVGSCWIIRDVVIERIWF
jgi:hypothetical protein